MGTTALLYSVSRLKYRQARLLLTGFRFSGTAGAVEVSALAAREDNPASELKNKVYAIRAGYSPSDNVNYGLTVGTLRQRRKAQTTGPWTVHTNTARAVLRAEYTKSSSNANNDAYAIVSELRI